MDFERLNILFSAFESKAADIAVTKLAIRTIAVCFLTPAITYGLFAIKGCQKICKYKFLGKQPAHARDLQ